MRLRLAVLLVAAFGAASARAAEYDYGDTRLELTGSVKSLYTYTRAVMTDDFVSDLRTLDPAQETTRESAWGLLTRARLTAEAVWQDRVYAQLVYDNELRNGSLLDTLAFEVADEIGTQTWLNWDRSYSEHGSANWRHAIYRGWVRWQEEGFDLTVGRQRIALGRGRLWNPEDLFNPIFPLAVEGDQRIGQDSAVARLRLAEGIWASAIVSPQDDYHDYRSAVRFDYESVQLDAGVMFGDFRGDLVWGLDFASNLGDAAVRGEATYTSIRGRDNIWQVVASLDYNFDVGKGLYALVEYLYNENTVDSLDPGPAPNPLSGSSNIVRALARGQVSILDRITTVRKHQLGAQASYEITPLLTGIALVLYDWDGRSAAFAPALSYSPVADVVVSVAGQLFVGKASGRNDYGDTPGLLVVSAEVYF